MIGLLAPALAGVMLLSRPLVQLLIAEQFRNATIADPSDRDGDERRADGAGAHRRSDGSACWSARRR